MGNQASSTYRLNFEDIQEALKNKENYIELCGEEEYEHMFLFPNYN